MLSIHVDTKYPRVNVQQDVHASSQTSRISQGRSPRTLGLVYEKNYEYQQGACCARINFFVIHNTSRFLYLRHLLALINGSGAPAPDLAVRNQTAVEKNTQHTCILHYIRIGCSNVPVLSQLSPMKQFTPRQI